MPGAITGGGGVVLPDAVGSSQIADGSVATADVADGAVTTAKLAAQAVTPAKVSRTGGSSGQVLTHQGAGADPVWSTPSTGLTDPTTTRGDLIVRGASSTTRLAIGTSGKVLASDGTDAVWSTPSVASTDISDSTTVGRALVTATDAAAARTTLSAVSTARTIAGSDLTADISATTLRSGLSLATIPSTPSTTPIVDLRADMGVTSSSGRVSAWASQGSVGSVSFAQATAGRQPLLLTNATGSGMPALYFDSTRTDTLTTAYNASLDPASALTIIFVGVIRTTSSVIYERPYASTHTGTFADWWLYAGNGVVDMRVNSSTSSQSVNDGAGISAWRRPSVSVYRLASGARKYRVNSYDLTTSATGATISYTNNIGHRIGSNSSDGEAATMWLYELLLFSSSLTDAQVAEWDATLSQRWGVPLFFG